MASLPAQDDDDDYDDDHHHHDYDDYDDDDNDDADNDNGYDDDEDRVQLQQTLVTSESQCLNFILSRNEAKCVQICISHVAKKMVKKSSCPKISGRTPGLF